MAGPLAGVRVLDLTRLLPGAFATALLGDLGADVIKVEQPGVGDPMRTYEPKLGHSSAFTWVVDRNKRSIVLNLNESAGIDIIKQLAEKVDVVIEGFRPGVAERFGIGYEVLRAVNPALVYCSLSGYGQDGPIAQEAGHDINYIGRAGILSITGTEGRPVLPGVQIADIAGGSLMSLVGLLAALFKARISGEGDHVDVSLTEGAFALHSINLGQYFKTGEVPTFESEMLNGGYPCYNVYACADGLYLTVGALEPRFWNKICERTSSPHLLKTHSDPKYIDAWREVWARHPRAQWLELFEDEDACIAPVNTLAEAIEDPALHGREAITWVEHPELGPTPQLAPPIRLREHPASLRTQARPLGGDTRAVLAEIGYEPQQIEALIADGVAAVAAAD